MLETFGDSYRAYVARTGRGRPVDTVKPVPTEIFKSAGKNDLGPNFVPFSQHPIKNGWRAANLPGLFVAVVESARLVLSL